MTQAERITTEERFTPEQKFKCAAREWEMRRRVYPRLVAQGKMKQEKADLEIAMMAEIADDYREWKMLGDFRGA